MRANGTRTRREMSTEVARIAQQINAVEAALLVLQEGTPAGRTNPAVGDAWNGLHDAVTALRAEMREVEMNLPTTRTALGDLVAENRD